MKRVLYFLVILSLRQHVHQTDTSETIVRGSIEEQSTLTQYGRPLDIFYPLTSSVANPSGSNRPPVSSLAPTISETAGNADARRDA